MNIRASGFLTKMILVFVLIALIVSCNKDGEKIIRERGNIVETLFLNLYPTSNIETYIQIIGVKSLYPNIPTSSGKDFI